MGSLQDKPQITFKYRQNILPYFNIITARIFY